MMLDLREAVTQGILRKAFVIKNDDGGNKDLEILRLAKDLYSTTWTTTILDGLASLDQMVDK